MSMPIESRATPKVNLRRRRRRTIAFVSEVSISELFGRLSYSQINLNFPQADSNMNILYGDNGSGKTTILNLIYACLSPETNAGLRSFISKTPFREFTIRFTDEKEIVVQKTRDLVGEYIFTVSDRADKARSYLVRVDHDNDVPAQESVVSVEEEIHKIGIDVLFVDHERYVRSTHSFLDEAVGETVPSFVWDMAEAGANRRHSRRKPIQFPLVGMVGAVDNVFRRSAFRQGNLGEVDASNVYLEISKALIRPKKRGPSTVEKMPLDEGLFDLEQRTSSFKKHGLLPSYPFEELRQVYSGASKAKKISITDALTPFMTSVERRITALSEVHDLMTTYETELNNFLHNKRASVHALDGLVINDRNGPLELSSLSSGEKQLVFLLSSAVVARGTRSLILIDEPELSLNYKWQRMIARSLASLSNRQSTQFVLASHSIEIISKYASTSQELVSDFAEADL